MKYRLRKKPVEVDAVLWDGENVQEVLDFMNWRNAEHDRFIGLRIHTLEGIMKAEIGDYIIKGVKGEFYPCKPDIALLTYDIV